VERALKSLKKSGSFGADSPEELAGMMNMPLNEAQAFWQSEPVNLSKQALNKWVEGPLTKYVKRDMASPEDPIRKLAEQGILHYVPERASEEFIHPTQKFMGKSRLARDWEEVADLSLDQHLAGEVPRWELGPMDDWIKKLDPTTPVYQAGSTYGYDSGFRHLVDELQNSLNPNSDLPRHLRLTPEQMQQMGIEKAVRHVADVNAWRAAQKAEANAKLAQSPAVHLVKEYPENNPKGLRWVELKQPETTPEVLAQWEREYPERVQESGHDAVARNKLQEQLKYEGDMMGHCVGGYCEDVANGNSRIFSLRDAKGEPHVTIEASPIMSKLSGDTLNEIYPGIWDKVVDEGGHRDLHKWVRENKPEVVDMMSIMQIKGKANKAPIDEYVPFVQDFIKSQPWGSIRDLQNAQMWKHPKTGQYFTKAETEADEALQSIYDSRNLDDDGNYVGGYAEGGKVPTREEYLQQLGVTFQD
jgi:hypothetical protein